MRACMLVCETKGEKSSKSDAYNNNNNNNTTKRRRKKEKKEKQRITLEKDVRGNMMAEARPDFIS